MTKNNELTLHSEESHVKPLKNIELSDFESLKSFIKTNFGQTGFCVYYLDYGVMIGQYDGNDFQFYDNEEFEPRFIQKMRLFNENRELYLWRKIKNKFEGRLRIDGSGQKTDVVDAKQVLWGTKSTPLGDFTAISEKRGTKIILPFKDISVNEREDRIFILTRNYISYDTNDLSYKQAGYVDCRFITFTDKNGKYLGGDTSGK